MTQWTVDSIPSQAGRTALVTGANSGIGLETARCLAAKGAAVILGCRNEAKGLAAVAEIQRTVPGAKVELLQVDLADLDSVRTAATRVKAAHPVLDLMCNNAGVMGHHSVQLTKQGFEMQFGTNHLGHFALTALLLDLLKAAPAARVVAVTSVAQRLPKALNLDDPKFERTRYHHFDAYAKSKAANLSFALELNRRSHAAGLALTACAAHPGYSATNITSGTNQAGNKFKDAVVGFGNALLGMPPARGALPTLYGATSAEITGGEFIGPDGLFELWGRPTVLKPSALARDEALAARLWQKSEEWTGVRFLSR